MAKYEAALAPNNTETEIPVNRTQSPAEGLEDSLLSILTTSNSTNLTSEVLDEAFCRDTEAFSEAFQVDDLFHRPEGCQPISSNICAMLYDR